VGEKGGLLGSADGAGARSGQLMSGGGSLADDDQPKGAQSRSWTVCNWKGGFPVPGHLAAQCYWGTVQNSTLAVEVRCGRGSWKPRQEGSVPPAPVWLQSSATNAPRSERRSRLFASPPPLAAVLLSPELPRRPAAVCGALRSTHCSATSSCRSASDSAQTSKQSCASASACSAQYSNPQSPQ